MNALSLNRVLLQTKALERIKGHRLGKIVRLDLDNDQLWIDFEGNPFGKPIVAELGTPWLTLAELKRWHQRVKRILVEFTEGQPGKPVVRDLFFSLSDLNHTQADQPLDKVIELEAERIIIKAQKQLILQCGTTQTIYNSQDSEITQEADQIESTARKNYNLKGGNLSLN